MRKTTTAGIVWVLLAALPWASIAAGADQKPALITFLSAASDGSLTHPVGEVVDLSLPFSVTETRRFELYLSPLLGEYGDPTSLQHSIEEVPAAKAKNGRLPLTVEPGLLTLRLKGPALATAGKYSGTLAVIDGGKMLQSHRLVLTRASAPRTAKVVVE